MSFSRRSSTPSMSRRSFTPSVTQPKPRSQRSGRSFSGSDAILVLAAIVFPPLAALLADGCGAQLVICFLLTMLGWFPGLIHAIWLIFRKTQRKEHQSDFIYVGAGQYAPPLSSEVQRSPSQVGSSIYVASPTSSRAHLAPASQARSNSYRSHAASLRSSSSYNTANPFNQPPQSPVPSPAPSPAPVVAERNSLMQQYQQPAYEHGVPFDEPIPAYAASEAASSRTGGLGVKGQQEQGGQGQGCREMNQSWEGAEKGKLRQHYQQGGAE